MQKKYDPALSKKPDCVDYRMIDSAGDKELLTPEGNIIPKSHPCRERKFCKNYNIEQCVGKRY